MVQQLTDSFWQAEARSEETKKFIQDIKRATRRKFTPEEKIAIVLEGFRRDTPIRDLCHREGIHPGTYYAWLKDFMEAGKESLPGMGQHSYGWTEEFSNCLVEK
jgi:transposase-like protein